VTHLLSLLAERRGIPYIGYAHSFFPGRIQLTSIDSFRECRAS